MRSRYCTTFPLGVDGDGGAPHHLAYSSLTGNVTLIDELCHALLEDDDHGGPPLDGLDSHEIASIEERLDFMTQRGFRFAEPAQEQAAVEQLTRSIQTLRREMLQFLFVFHPDAGSTQARESAVDAAVASLPRLLTRFAPKRCHFHFWVLEPFHVDLLHHAIERLMTVFPEPDGEAGGRPETTLPQPTFVVNTSGMLPLSVRTLRQRFGMGVVMKVVVDRRFIDESGSLDAYLERLYRFVDEVASQGQASNLFLNATRGSEELFRDILLERFMDRGLNRAVVTRYYLSAVTRKTSPVDFYCDLDGIDFELWSELLREMAKRPRYRMFTLYGGGVVSKLQRLLSFKKTLLPDIHFCPIVPNALTFDLAGNLWVCPKTAFRRHDGTALEPVGRYQPELEIDDDRLRSWWDFSVHDRPGCSECPDAFICGGGCPLVAKQQDPAPGRPDAACQPAGELLNIGVEANIEHLMRKFGPGARTRS